MGVPAGVNVTRTVPGPACCRTMRVSARTWSSEPWSVTALALCDERWVACATGPQAAIRAPSTAASAGAAGLHLGDPTARYLPLPSRSAAYRFAVATSNATSVTFSTRVGVSRRVFTAISAARSRGKP